MAQLLLLPMLKHYKVVHQTFKYTIWRNKVYNFVTIVKKCIVSFIIITNASALQTNRKSRLDKQVCELSKIEFQNRINPD